MDGEGSLVSAGRSTPSVPYYQDDLVTIYHGDCREVLPRLGSVRVVLTDPPYGQAFVSNGRAEKFSGITGDDQLRLDWLPAVARVHEPAGALFVFCGEWSVGHVSEACKDARYGLGRVLIWHKGKKMSQGDLENFGLVTEFIVFGYAHQRRKGTLKGLRGSNVLAIPRVDSRLLVHPAEKPRALLEMLIARSSDFGEVVLDPFAGSGSTLRAAKDLGRRAVGIEIEERYCEIAAKRCAQEVMELAV